MKAFTALLLLVCLQFFIPTPIRLFAVAKKTRDPVRTKQEILDRAVHQDQADLTEPYIGGFNSQKATFLTVEYHPFDYIQKQVNARWRAEREMVEDMQKMLLTGGVKTNLFRDKKQLELAKEFLESQPEVKRVKVGNANPNGRVVYGDDL